MKVNWRRCINCLMVGLATVIIAALAYSINLGIKQQQEYVKIGKALDNIIYNVEILKRERNRLLLENKQLKEMEDKTTEEMNGLD